MSWTTVLDLRRRSIPSEMTGPASEHPTRFVFVVEPTNEATHLVRTEARRWFDFGSDSVASQLLTALTEVVQNSVEAHDEVGHGGVIQIIFTVDPSSCRVVDTGAGFDWETIRDSVPDPSSPSGRGLMIARAFIPGLVVTTGSSGTTVDLPFEGATRSSRRPDG